MKTTINEHQFQRAFENIRPDNFSYSGQKALFEHLEEFEQDTGEELKLDVIALCCEYTEYETIEEYNMDYNEEHESYQDITETVVIPIDDDSFIIQQY